MTSKHYEKWYYTHKDEFNGKRRERYKKDKGYRARLKSYANKKTIPNPVEILHDGVSALAFPISYVAKEFGCTRQNIINWEKKGWIPKPTIDMRARHYLKHQFALMFKLHQVLATSKSRSPDKNEFDLVVSEIREGWNNGTSNN